MRSMSPERSGSAKLTGAASRIDSTRRSVTGASRSTRSPTPGASGSNARNAVPCGIVSTARSGKATEPRPEVRRTSAPSSTPMRSRSLRCTSSSIGCDQRCERRRAHGDAAPVVQRAPGHEAESVRVAPGSVVPAPPARPTGGGWGAPRSAARAASASASASAGSAPGTSVSVRPGFTVVLAPVPLASTTPVAHVRRDPLLGGDGAGLDRLPRRVGERDADREPSTSSSWCSTSGSTTPSRARSQQPGVDARERGRDAVRSRPGPRRQLEVEVHAEAQRELARRCASRHGRAVRARSAAPTRCTRPSRLVTLPAFSPHMVTGRKTSARLVLSVTNASIAIVKPTALSARSPARGRGSRHAGRCRAARARGCEPLAAAPRIPAASRPRARRDRAPRIGEPVAAGVERDPTGQEAGREAEVERAAHVAAAQRRRGTWCRGSGRAPTAAWTVASADSARSPRPSTTTIAVAPASSRPRGQLGDRVASPSDRGERSRRALLAGQVAHDGARVPGEALVARGELDERDAELVGGAPDPQVEDRQLFLEVECRAPRSPRRCRSRRWSRRADRARRRRGDRHRAARRRCRCRSRPWRSGPTRTRPRWSRARRRAARPIPGRAGRCTLRSPSAAASSASGHEHSTSSPSCAPSGCGPAPRSARPRSRTGPCRRASRGSPARCRRRAGGRAGWSSTGAAPRHCTEHVVQLVSTARGPTGGPGTGTASR